MKDIQGVVVKECLNLRVKKKKLQVAQKRIFFFILWSSKNDRSFIDVPKQTKQ